MVTTVFAASFPADGALAISGWAGLGSNQLLLFIGAIVGLTILMVSTARRIRQSRNSPPDDARERYLALQ